MSDAPPTQPGRSDTRAYARSLALCLAIATVIFTAGVLLLGLGTAYPGDETRFIETSKLFGSALSLDLLTHYEEMSTPLPFVYFGYFGKLFGYELATMRIGALIVALATVIALHGLLYLCLPTARAVAGLFTLTVINPYFVTMGVFVYTDMPALLFVLLVCIGLLKRTGWLLCIGIAGALLCRQYMAFIVGAAGLWLVLEYLQAKRPDTIKLLIMLVLGVVPMACLLVLWGGPAPKNEVKQLYLQYPTRYHLSACVLYIALLSIYLLPMLLYLAPRLIRERLTVAGCLIASLIYIATPVRPSLCSLDAGYITVGLFDRALTRLGANTLTKDIVFWVGFAVGLTLLTVIIRDVFRRIRQRSIDPVLLSGLSIACFLVVMPWSYLTWEKYFLPVLPKACVSVWAISKTSDTTAEHAGPKSK